MQLKFLQINVWWGGLLWDSLVDFIAKEDPDILTIQEVYNGTDETMPSRFRTVTEFQKRLNFPYADFAAEFKHIVDEGIVDQGNAILSKFPIKNRSSQFFVGEYRERIREDDADAYENVPRTLQCVTLDVNGTDVNVFCVHGIVDNRGDFDSPARLHMSEVIVDATKNKSHVILAGDFNVEPQTQTIRNIEQHLTNVFKDELTSTFNTRRKERPVFAKLVVDFLFVTPTMKVITHECPDVDISDHRPLIATLEL